MRDDRRICGKLNQGNEMQVGVRGQTEGRRQNSWEEITKQKRETKAEHVTESKKRTRRNNQRIKPPNTLQKHRVQKPRVRKERMKKQNRYKH